MTGEATAIGEAGTFVGLARYLRFAKYGSLRRWQEVEVAMRGQACDLCDILVYHATRTYAPL